MIYPEVDLETQDLTDLQIEEGVDKYLEWRRKHEDKEGILEPGRAEVLVHTTSPEAVIAILEDGHLRSIFNLLCKSETRVDMMQGGKAKWIAGATEEVVEADEELQQLVMNERGRLLEHMPWIPESEMNFYLERLDLAENIKEIAGELWQLIEEGRKRGYFGNVTKTGLALRKREWLHIANLLPKDARQIIAEKSDAERYISTTLGHALEKIHS